MTETDPGRFDLVRISEICDDLQAGALVTADDVQYILDAIKSDSRESYNAFGKRDGFWIPSFDEPDELEDLDEFVNKLDVAFVPEEVYLTCRRKSKPSPQPDSAGTNTEKRRPGRKENDWILIDRLTWWLGTNPSNVSCNRKEIRARVTTAYNSIVHDPTKKLALESKQLDNRTKALLDEIFAQKSKEQDS